MAVMEEPKKPSPWLQPTLTSIGITWAVITTIVTVRHWKDPGADSVVTLISLANVALLSAFMIYATWRNWKDARRAKRLEIAMDSLKNTHKIELRYACSEKVRKCTEEMKASEYPLMQAGKLMVLAEDALWLSDIFGTILGRNKGTLDLTHPLIDSLVTVGLSDDGLIPWQRVHLISWYAHYCLHKHHIFELSLTAFESDVIRKTPAELGELDGPSISTMLVAHRRALVDKAQELAAPYLEAKGKVTAQAAKLLAETKDNATISLIVQA
jgi:hypothetical protein